MELSRIEELAGVKRSQIALARSLLAANVPTGDILSHLTAINRELHVKLLDHAVAVLRHQGMEEPGIPVTLLIMGSGGRGESFLNPDQDNAFILGNYPDEEHARLDPYFIALAERFNDDLARVGFPLCDGNIMARNPVWRKTLAQWQEQIARWTRRRDPVAVRFADALLDFEAIAGPSRPALDVRRQLTQAFQSDPAVATEMCRDAPLNKVALNWLGHLRIDGTGENEGRVDLKTHGILPLIASTRVWALVNGLEMTGTGARLTALRDAGVLADDEADALRTALDRVSRCILRQQVEDAGHGRRIGYFVDPTATDRPGSGALAEALRTIGAFADTTRALFAGELY